MNIFKNFVYNEYIKLYTLFEKIFCIYSFEKFCTMNVRNCIYIL